MDLSNIVNTFLRKNCRPDKPIVLAYSGGVDSLCLLQLLMINRTCYSELHMAHVDHGWREESGRQAEKLGELAENLGLPFHLHVIDKERLRGNLEDACRKERISFFLDVARETGAQAVVLAHHADDQAETILKRIFEGGCLFSISGMKSSALWDGTPFWRPLLEVPKNQIVKFAKQQGVLWINDPANEDTAFLRARMRLWLMPLLCLEFGKNPAPGLCRLGNDIEEMFDYIASAAQETEPQKIEGPFGVCYDFSKRPPISHFEWKYHLKRICRAEGFVIGHEKLKTAATLLEHGAANKEIEYGREKFIIDRKKAFFLKLADGTWELTEGKNLTNSNWTDVFRGTAFAGVPKGVYRITSAKNGLIYRGSSTLGSWWSKHKIPHCVRHLAPVIIHSDETVHEFLTGIGSEGQEQGVVLKFKKLCC